MVSLPVNPQRSFIFCGIWLSQSAIFFLFFASVLHDATYRSSCVPTKTMFLCTPWSLFFSTIPALIRDATIWAPKFTRLLLILLQIMIAWHLLGPLFRASSMAATN